MPQSNNLRIAIIYHSFPHYRKGVLDALTDVYSHNVTFFGSTEERSGIRCHKFKVDANFRVVATWHIGPIVIQPAIPIIAAIENFDVFIFLANPNHLTTWIAAILARIRRKRVIFWGHGFRSDTPTLKNRIRSVFFTLANAFYTYGFRAKENAIALGFEPDSIHVGFNSLNYKAQILERERLQSLHIDPSQENGRDILRILCISRLTKACRYDILLNAISDASGISQHKYALTFIGDGPDRKYLETRCKDLNLNHVFVGAQYDEKSIANYMYAADVVVSPGKVGLTAMHSLMYGIPVISNNSSTDQMPEIEAIIPGHTGQLFEAGNTKQLAEILANFFNHFPSKSHTQESCFKMIDEIYNPTRQVQVLSRAINGLPALKGDDAFTLFK
ncbi:UDP-D-galactose:(glucosyl)lipopolysaccharide-1,6-D-galactosyltransferase [Hydrogenophaga sp. T4]|nr:UDP-D-galactose:(glucosyl)lipopolysaccharide-1,6-D-galactosyltransferase [Hydrogenophaga sp. T4]